LRLPTRSRSMTPINNVLVDPLVGWVFHMLVDPI
ncbi:MAG: hypothetical protein ACI93T_001358, partial [Porticoccaceae bacterium]